MFKVLLLSVLFASVQCFVVPAATFGVRSTSTSTSSLQAGDDKLAEMVTGEQLEIMMTEWEQPLVVDAYATVSKHM